MKDFRRSVIRLFMATFFLLLIAWVGMKAMQYRGDYERMLRDARRFLRGNDVTVFIQHKAIPFFQRKIIPAAERMIHSVEKLFT